VRREEVASMSTTYLIQFRVLRTLYLRELEMLREKYAKLFVKILEEVKHDESTAKKNH